MEREKRNTEGTVFITLGSLLDVLARHFQTTRDIGIGFIRTRALNGALLALDSPRGLISLLSIVHSLVVMRANTASFFNPLACAKARFCRWTSSVRIGMVDGA